MGLEIERKFLINKQLWQAPNKGQHLAQGYIAANAHKLSVRIRIADDTAWLNLKGWINDISRHEYEYPIPISDARELLNNFAGSIVEKIRYQVDYAGHTWEVDEFLGDNAGLMVAEIELDSEAQEFDKPDWIAKEVSDDPRYLNTSLAQMPFSKWDREDK